MRPARLIVVVAALGLLAGCSGSGERLDETSTPSGSHAPGGSGRGGQAPRSGLDGLKGLTAAQAENLLGPATFRRIDRPAEIWQYRMEACTLDLFLYPQGPTLQVAHAAARGSTGGPTDPRACLDSVVAARSAKP
jgi:hypothetical protein